MGQFTGLFKGLEATDTKTKPKAIKNERNSDKPEKSVNAALAAKGLPKQPKTEKPRSISKTVPEATAPMRGKRSHPDYTQAPAFVRKNTYKAVKIALIKDERGLDYSDLIEELLNGWLSNR